MLEAECKSCLTLTQYAHKVIHLTISTNKYYHLDNIRQYYLNRLSPFSRNVDTEILTVIIHPKSVQKSKEYFNKNVDICLKFKFR